MASSRLVKKPLSLGPLAVSEAVGLPLASTAAKPGGGATMELESCMHRTKNEGM